MKLFRYLVLGVFSFSLHAQEIKMYFPHFAGKSYDFIIFQGSESKTVMQGVIPENGYFQLKIPKDYSLYTGMSRWLITGTREGGGLDMFVLGKDFSVSCDSDAPNEKNIVFKNNDSYKALNDLYREQEGILKRYESMLFATKSYPKTDKNYSNFQHEVLTQKQSYNLFQDSLEKKGGYVGKFLQIVNLTRGKGNRIFENSSDEAENINHFIVNTLEWPLLYTSGHWTTVLNIWVGIHSDIFKDEKRFAKDFKTITSKIKSPEQYTDFVNRVLYSLRELGRDDYISVVNKSAIASGKYLGELIEANNNNQVISSFEVKQ